VTLAIEGTNATAETDKTPVGGDHPGVGVIALSHPGLPAIGKGSLMPR
jgi:hypothetical protein